MLKKSSRILVLFLVLAVVAVFSAAGFAETKTLTVMMHTSWLMEGEKAAFNLAEKKLGVKFEFNKVAEGTPGEQVIQAAFAAGDVPDILNWHIANYVKPRLGGDLFSSKFEDLSGMKWTKYYDAAKLKWPTFTIDKKLLMAPFGSVTAMGWWYNKAVLKTAGITKLPNSWTEFLADCDKIKKIGKIPVYYSIKDAWTDQLIPLLGMVRETRKQSVAEIAAKMDAHQLKWVDIKSFVDSLAKEKELVDKGYVNKTYLSDTYTMAEQALLNGDCAFYGMGEWMTTDLAKISTEKLKSNIGVMAFPFDGNDWIYTGAPYGLYVPSQGKNVALAKKVVDFLVSPEAMTAFFKAQPGLPFIKGLKLTNLYPHQKDIIKLMETGKAGPYPMDFTKYAKGPFEVYIADMLIGNKTPEQVAAELDNDFAKQAKDADDPNWK